MIPEMSRTERELVGGESRRRSTRPRADLRGQTDRANPSIRHRLGQVSIGFPILYTVLRIPTKNFLPVASLCADLEKLRGDR